MIVSATDLQFPEALIVSHIKIAFPSGRLRTTVFAFVESSNTTPGCKEVHTPDAPYNGSSAFSVTLSLHINGTSCPALAVGFLSNAIEIFFSADAQLLFEADVATSFIFMESPAT